MATFEARITKVEQDLGSEWYRISTDHGEIKRLDTKDPGRAREAVTAKDAGTAVLIKYTRRPTDKINPHTNQPYPDNFYFDSVETPEPEPAQQKLVDGVDIVEPISRRTNPSDAWRISLAAGAKLAVQMLPSMPEGQRNFATAQQMALVWGHWLFTTEFPEPAHRSDEEIPF